MFIKIDDVGRNIQQEGTEEMNKITGIVAGQYGQSIPLTVVDDEGTGLDLSAYTAVIIRAISPDARTTLEWTGAIVSATAGTISFSPSSGITFDRDGMWRAQAQFTDTGILALSAIFEMDVERAV